MSPFKRLLLLLLVQLSRPSPEDAGALENQLVLLTMAPFLQEGEPDPSWFGGPALIPAVRLAVEQINNRSDILPGFNLSMLVGNSGCNLVPRTIVNFTSHLFHHDMRQRVIGIVGPSCSASALTLEPLLRQPRINLMSVSLSSTPDIRVENSTGSKFANTFRTIGSSLVEVDAFYKMAREFGWTRVGGMYEVGRKFHTSTFREFKGKFNSTLNFTYAFFESNFEGFVQALDTELIRVVYVFAGEEFARNTLCLAYLNELVYPRVQFIFHLRVREDFTRDVVSVNGSMCTLEDMELALNGVILVNQRNNTDSSDTVSGVSYAEYLSLYEERYSEYLRENDIDRVTEVSSSATIYFDAYYDATWALALAIDKTAGRFNLSEYSLGHSKEITDDIRRNLEDSYFEGMSGLITFDPKTRDVRTIGTVLQQIINGRNVTGHFNNGTLDFDGEYINDTFQRETQGIPLAMGIITLIVALVLLILLFILQIVFFKHSDVKDIKATSPMLNHLIFSGCYLFILLLMLFTVQETFPSEMAENPVVYGVTCSSLFWSLALGYTLIFGTVASKTWRIYRIFSHFKQGRVKYVSDEHLIFFITLLVFIDFVLLMAWNINDPWHLTTRITGRSGMVLFQRHSCQCDQLVVWLAVLFTYKGLLTGLAVYLSILVRRVKRKAFKRTKKVIVLIYSLVVIFFVGFTLYGVFFDSVHVISFLALVLTFIISVVLIAISLFLTNIWPVLIGKEEGLSRAESSTTHKSQRKCSGGGYSRAVSVVSRTSVTPPIPRLGVTASNV